MQTLAPLFTLGAVLATSFLTGLFLQWLTLHALFHLLPGRRRPSVAQVAMGHTRRVIMPLGHRQKNHVAPVARA